MNEAQRSETGRVDRLVMPLDRWRSSYGAPMFDEADQFIKAHYFPGVRSPDPPVCVWIGWYSPSARHPRLDELRGCTCLMKSNAGDVLIGQSVKYIKRNHPKCDNLLITQTLAGNPKGTIAAAKAGRLDEIDEVAGWGGADAHYGVQGETRIRTFPRSLSKPVKLRRPSKGHGAGTQSGPLHWDPEEP